MYGVRGGPRASEFAKAVFFDLNFVYTSKTPVFPKELAQPHCPPSVFADSRGEELNSLVHVDPCCSISKKMKIPRFL